VNKLSYRTEGSYNVLNYSDKSAQYVFNLREDAPKELKRSFLIDLGKDNHFTGSALEVAYELQAIIDSYWINTDKEKIKFLVEYLEKWSEKDEYDGLKLERERLTKQLATVENKLGGFDPEEWENWKPEAIGMTELHSVEK
jgi:hypothetical protein